MKRTTSKLTDLTLKSTVRILFKLLKWVFACLIFHIKKNSFRCFSIGLGYYKGEGAHHVTLSPSCYAYQAGTIMHELMHRVGFHHEHTRPDRDSYIAILWDNISNGKSDVIRDILLK